MNYNETIEYLFKALPMFSRSGAKAYKADLVNITRLCDYLGHPEYQFKSIHVAGTNGKGSVSHMLAAVLQNNNYSCGLFTSPHLYDFRERIRINGEMISEDFVVDFIEKIKSYSEEVNPSFFELTFAMAVDYFASKNVDVAIIETGLGGRLDSTNIITPILSVITNIGYDHMEFLGDTLEQIAGEKAGIIKKNIPVVIGESQDATKEVFLQKAEENNVPIYFADENFEVTSSHIEKEKLDVTVSEKNEKEPAIYLLDLIADYQKRNLLTALQTLKLLKKNFDLNENRTKEALSNVTGLTGLKGRWQVISNNPKIILDVAHNADGMRQVAFQIEKSNYNHLHIVIGMVSDKNVSAVFDLLPKHASYYFTKANIPRAMNEAQLQKKAGAFDLKGKTYSTVMQAVNAAMSNASNSDLILVCGSVFVVAEVDTDIFKKN